MLVRRFTFSTLVILLLLCTLWLQAQPHLLPSDILKELYADSGWIQIDSLNNGQCIFTKRIAGSDIPATMVKQVAAVSSTALLSAIEDVENYLNFIHDPYLKRSDLLKKTPHYIDGYQFFDLPFIANRHTIFRMVKNDGFDDGRVRFEWTLVPRESEYAAFLDSMDVIYKNPVYLALNTGGWEIIPLSGGKVEVTYRLHLDPAGWVPDFLVARGNLINAPKMVENMIKEAVRREKKND